MNRISDRFRDGNKTSDGFRDGEIEYEMDG